MSAQPEEVDVPTVLNPEAIGDLNQSPIVQLPPGAAALIRIKPSPPVNDTLYEALRSETLAHYAAGNLPVSDLNELGRAAAVLAENPDVALLWGRLLTGRTTQQPADPDTVRVALALTLDAMGVEGRHDRMAADLLTTLTACGFTLTRTAP